jgi:hypothetical protein
MRSGGSCWAEDVEDSTVVRVWRLVMKDWMVKMELLHAVRMPPQEPSAEMKCKE